MVRIRLASKGKLILGLLAVYLQSCVLAFNAETPEDGTTTTTTKTLSIICSGQGERVTLEAVYPTKGANWNDYIKNNNGGTNAYDQPDVECENGGLPTAATYDACLHGGELRKAVLTGLDSCDDITVTDELGVFDWTCDSSGGTATAYSVKLKDDKNLSDLLDGANGFKANKVNVANSKTCLYESELSTSWWANSVLEPPKNNGVVDAVNLDNNGESAGRIFVITENEDSNGYNLNDDKLSFVVMPGVFLTYGGLATKNCSDATGELSLGSDHRTILCTGSQKYLWIEGSFVGQPDTGSTAEVGVYGKITKFSHYRNYSYFFGGTYGMLFGTSDSQSFRSILIAKTAGQAFWFLNSDYNTVYDLRVGKTTANSAVLATAGSANNRFEIVRVNDASANGIELINADDNSFYNIVVSDSGTSGISVSDAGSSGNIFQDVKTYNNAASGMSVDAATDTIVTRLITSGNTSRGFSATNNAHRTVVSHCSSSNNGAAGVYLQNVADVHIFQCMAFNETGSGFYLEATNTANIINSGAAHTGGETITLDAAVDTKVKATLFDGEGCLVMGGSGNELNNSCDHGTGTATPSTVWASTTTVFIGHWTAVDTVNKATAYIMALASITDWFDFENFFRFWGKSTGDIWPDDNLRGRCTGVNCQLLDFRIRDGSELNRAIGYPGSGTCPLAVDASVTAADSGVVTSVVAGGGQDILVNAVEIWGDGIGDDNGLCESDEACIGSPNIGAYQGEGSTTACAQTNGPGVSGFSMSYFETTSAALPD